MGYIVAGSDILKGTRRGHHEHLTRTSPLGVPACGRCSWDIVQGPEQQGLGLKVGGVRIK